MLLTNKRASLSDSIARFPPSNFRKKSNNQPLLLIKLGLPWIIYALWDLSSHQCSVSQPGVWETLGELRREKLNGRSLGIQ